MAEQHANSSKALIARRSNVGRPKFSQLWSSVMKKDLHNCRDMHEETKILLEIFEEQKFCCCHIFTESVKYMSLEISSH